MAKEENHTNPEDKRTEQKFFRVHTSVVFQLGESLISDVVQALVELVKNAYDADATFARVLVDTKEPPPAQSQYPNASGYILIEDDGSGMDYQTIEDGWLTISDSKKRQQKKEKRLTVLGRTPLGDKGLGRLARNALGTIWRFLLDQKKATSSITLPFHGAIFKRQDNFLKSPFLSGRRPLRVALARPY